MAGDKVAEEAARVSDLTVSKNNVGEG